MFCGVWVWQRFRGFIGKEPSEGSGKGSTSGRLNYGHVLHSVGFDDGEALLVNALAIIDPCCTMPMLQILVLSCRTGCCSRRRTDREAPQTHDARAPVPDAELRAGKLLVVLNVRRALDGLVSHNFVRPLHPRSTRRRNSRGSRQAGMATSR